MDRVINRAMIELSANIDEADEYISRLGYKTVADKKSCLRDLFDVQLIGRNDSENVKTDESDEMDYYALLNVIINKKWGA